ncbi:hypothetical protein ACFVYT_41965, partial [Streptomyces sp. NPDC058290]
MSESSFTGAYGDEAAPDPDPAVVPAPRTGDRRAARRRRIVEAGPVPAAPPATAKLGMAEALRAVV